MRDPVSNDPVIFDIESDTLAPPSKEFLIRDINRDFLVKLKKSLSVCFTNVFNIYFVYNGKTEIKSFVRHREMIHPA